jgi:hypothetical protein
MRASDEITYSQFLPRDRTVQERSCVCRMGALNKPGKCATEAETTYQTELRHMNSTLDIKFWIMYPILLT